MWRYSAGVTTEHRARLGKFNSYSAIVDAISSSANRGGVYLNDDELGNDAMLGHRRPVFGVDLVASLGDPFFSGPYGYRRSYAESIKAGQDANRLVIDALLPILLRQKRAKARAAE